MHGPLLAFKMKCTQKCSTKAVKNTAKVIRRPGLRPGPHWAWGSYSAPLQYSWWGLAAPSPRTSPLLRPFRPCQLLANYPARFQMPSDATVYGLLSTYNNAMTQRCPAWSGRPSIAGRKGTNFVKIYWPHSFDRMRIQFLLPRDAAMLARSWES